MSYRIWWAWNDGVSGHVWLSTDDAQRLGQRGDARERRDREEQRRARVLAVGRVTAGTPREMFAVLNFAKINDSPMTRDWVMEVDWVKHEFLK